MAQAPDPSPMIAYVILPINKIPDPPMTFLLLFTGGMIAIWLGVKLYGVIKTVTNMVQTELNEECHEE